MGIGAQYGAIVDLDSVHDQDWNGCRKKHMQKIPHKIIYN